VRAFLYPYLDFAMMVDSFLEIALVQTKADELKIELLFLPAYSPNLNLIERLWKFVKKPLLSG